jgi:hypothetical protein
MQNLAPSQRILHVLTRLATEAKRRPLIQGLLDGYVRVIGFYGRASNLRAPPRWKELAHAVTATERQAWLEARRIGLPFCSPTARL